MSQRQSWWRVGAVVVPIAVASVALVGWLRGLYGGATALALLAFAAALLPSFLLRIQADRLHRARELTDSLFRLAPDAVLLVAPDGRVQRMNDEAMALLGWTPEELLGRRVEILVPPEVRQAHVEHRAAFAADPFRRGLGQGRELAVLRRDGSLLLVDISLGPVPGPQGTSTLVALRDVSEQRLARHRELLDTVMASAPAMIYVRDHEGRFVLANQAAAEAFGCDAEELLGRREDELGGDAEEVAARDRRLAAARGAGQPVGEAEEPFTARGGETRWFQTVRSPLTLSAESEPMVLTVGVDVSKRRELEARLRRLERLEAVGQLAGGVAHDFNNLLMVVLGHADLLLARPEVSGDTLRFHLEQVRQAGQSGAELTRQLLAFGRRQVLQPTVLDLNGLVTGLEPMLRRVLGENVMVATELEPALWPLRGDRGQLQQVLMNLVVNARDAMAGGGRIVVSTANRTREGEGPEAPAGRWVELAVADTGVGMDEATRARIFEPFFTTKGEKSGTGLGLATVHGIVEQSGGSIEVESAPGLGTTMRVLLPAVSAEAPAAAGEAPASAAAAAGRARGGETVLVVEDQDPVRRLVVLALERLGYRVRPAATVAEARALAADPTAGLDLLLTDVVLADGTGIELAAEMRAAQPRLPILLMSGYAAPGLLPEDDDDPRRDLLQKPFSPDELGRRVRRLLDLA